jgi:hypothetical protein
MRRVQVACESYERYSTALMLVPGYSTCDDLCSSCELLCAERAREVAAGRGSAQERHNVMGMWFNVV